VIAKELSSVLLTRVTARRMRNIDVGKPNSLNTCSDVISMPVGFRCHLVGKTLINVFYYDIAAIRFVGKLVIIQTFT